MVRGGILSIVGAIVALSCGLAGGVPAGRAEEATGVVATARVIAVGLPGAGAVSTVGQFHLGGPIHDKPEFAAYTQPGHILDPKRILVASSSNFGAPRARPGESEGAVVSIDPEATETLVIPPQFGARGDQASALGGRVQLFTAQSPAFLNGVTMPTAVTAELPAVSNPLGISINNAFGRLWFANTPLARDGIGTLSIVDPGGQPLANAPSKVSGGVFAGDRTNRQPHQMIDGGLRTGGIATALLGMSPDGSKRAVFALLTADGALIQAHTEQTVDGLAPPGTLTPLPTVADETVTRAGMAFNWVPDRLLYVTDPVRNRLAVIKLADDGKLFRVDSVRQIEAAEFDVPVDLAPAVPEVASPGFSSNSTLAGGSDLYVLNRGNGMVTRINQAGQVLATQRVTVAGETLGRNRLNGIAVSRDAQRIYLTVTGGLPGHAKTPGALIEIPAFGRAKAALVAPSLRSARPEVARGEALFQTAFTPQQGLGPLYNDVSCVACHAFPASGGAGTAGLAVVFRVGRFDGGSFDPLLGLGGPVARHHSIAELGAPCPLEAGLPRLANLVSVRNTPILFGAGLLDAIPDEAIRARAAVGGGRPNLVRDAEGRERVGRFGWKADTATLEQFVADAMRNELGITNPKASNELVAGPPECGGAPAPEDDGTILAALTAYLAWLPPPTRASRDSEGETLFAAAGCEVCHAARLAAGDIEVPLYSDLLLHDMGAALDDGVVQGQARGRDWRTTPLWGLGNRLRFLHDGRATTLAAAIAVHDGEAALAAAQFRRMAAETQARLISFLTTL